MSVTTEVHKAWISTECSCDVEFECWGDCYEDDLCIVGMVLDRWLIANGMDNDEPTGAEFTITITNEEVE